MRPVLMIALACAFGGAAPFAQESKVEDYPRFEAPELQRGREVWVATCAVCHTTDLAGAPLVTKAEAWAPRIAQGKSVLYAHALNGFHGPEGAEMPPRGGDSQLTDEEVRAAVDYMVALVLHLAGEKQ